MAATILVLEDNASVSLLIEEELLNAGFAVAGPFAFCSRALAFLETATPDAAILDVMLKDGCCHPVVEELKRRGVPFVIYSGRLRTEPAWSSFADAPWIDKPAPPHPLIQGVQTLLAAKAA
jgi:DNA-binding response OmpR family regulator